MSDLKWSADKKVCFEPITHTYWNGRKQLQGVTGYIGTLHDKFDANAKAATMTDKPWELLREWRLKGDKSREDGTSAHLVFERYFETGRIVIGDGCKDGVAAKFIQENFISGRLELVEVESICYNGELASMRDAIVRDKEGRYYIFDWKTNEEIKVNGYGRWLYPPYQMLPSADYYKYSLQLRLYQHMSRDYDIADCYIIHLQNDGYEFLKAEKINIK